MTCAPEKLTLKVKSDHTAVISSQKEDVAEINLNDSIWLPVSKDAKTDDRFMRSIQLSGETQKISNIGAMYVKDGDGMQIRPYFLKRETKNGDKISYRFSDTDSVLLEKVRENKDKIIEYRYWTYDTMGFESTDYLGYDVTDKKTGVTVRYNALGEIIQGQQEKEKKEKETKIASFWSFLNKKQQR